MVFIDPTLTMLVGGQRRAKGAADSDFSVVPQDLSQQQFIDSLKKMLGHLASRSVDEAKHFICMDWCYSFAPLSAARTVYGEPSDLCVWTRGKGSSGSLYRSDHKLIFVFQSGALGHHGKSSHRIARRSNVWQYRNSTLSGKSKSVVAGLYRGQTDRAGRGCHRGLFTSGRIVLDYFEDAGTTLIAAHRTGRRARAMALEASLINIRRCHSRGAPVFLLKVCASVSG